MIPRHPVVTATEEGSARMPTAVLNGIDLYYETTGDTGPTVVFLHGAGGNHLSWWQQVPTFSDHYRCIAIDHRGFGGSTDPSAEGTTRFADDLEALLAQLGDERVALVAQSMGGRTASEFALRHPERVWALVMCDTLGNFVWEELQPRRDQLREERLARAGEGGVILRGYMAPGFIARERERTFLYQQVQGLNPPRDASAPAPAATREQLAAFPVPTLFIVGDEDPVVAPEIVREVHALIPGAEYREFPGAGHSVYWEQPGEFNEALAAFLGRHAGSG
jgi:3-oxoadipate enol-lactonase